MLPMAVSSPHERHGSSWGLVSPFSVIVSSRSAGLRSDPRHGPLQVGHELVTRFLGAPEGPEHTARDHRSTALLHATHGQTEVLCFYDYAHPVGVQTILEEVGDLLGHSLLDLQPAGVHLHHARDLGQADYAATRQITHRGGPEERQHVVLAQRVERDALDDDHLAVADIEYGAVDQPVRVNAVADREFEPHPMHTFRRAEQAFALRVLADLSQNVSDGMLDDLGVACRLARPFPRRRLLGGSHDLVVFPTLDLVDPLAPVRR